MARPSNMSHQHLPPGASNGQYVKCVGGRIIWTTETPGGVVTEAGANAANAIGAASGADTSAKIKTLLGMELTPGLAVITALFSKVGGQSPSSLLSFNGIYLGSSKIADIVKTPLVILSGGCPTDYVL